MSVTLSSSDLEAIRQLLKIVTDNQLAELSISLRDGIAITIKTGASAQPPPAVAYLPAIPPGLNQPAQAALSAPGVEPRSASASPASRGVPVTSPMVGIYYQSPSPGEPPFVKVGDIVRVGQTIGLIEAMKVFSEIPSEAAGRVTELTADNGELVQLGQPLMYLEPA